MSYLRERGVAVLKMTYLVGEGMGVMPGEFCRRLTCAIEPPGIVIVWRELP